MAGHRWYGRAAAAAMMLAALSATVHAQYLFRYAVWGNYTPGGDGYPFSNQVCSGVTPVINYDDNPLTNNPKISNWCPQLGRQVSFGAQFAAILYPFVTGYYSFYAGSDDGSGLYIDGTQVMALPGEQPFTSSIVTVFLLGGVNHTYLLDYYANGFGGSAVQATVDPRINVSAPSDAAFNAIITITPDIPPIFLLATGLAALAVLEQLRRRAARRLALAEPPGTR